MLNLIEVQERLKGMPMDAIMGYAEGSNPDVPPYVALTELNRRKQMQQSAAAMQPMPKGTVAQQVQQESAAMMPPPMSAAPEGIAGLPGAAGGEEPPVQMAEGGSVDDAAEFGGGPLGKLLSMFSKKSKKALKSDAKPEGAWEPNPEGEWTPETLVVSPGDVRKVKKLGNTGDGEYSGVASLPTKKPSTVEQPSGTKPTGDAFLEEYRKKIEALNPGKAKTPEELALQVKTMNEMFGIREPGGEQAERIAAMERLLQERSGLYDKQKQGRGFDKNVQMLRAFAQAPRGQQFGAAAGEGSKLRKEGNAADLAEQDRRLMMDMKMSELRQLNEAKQQAFRQGNLNQYLQLDAEQKTKQAEFNKLQAQAAGEQYKTEKQSSTELEKQRIANEGRLNEQRLQNEGMIKAAGVRASGSGSGNDIKYAQLRAKVAADVDKALAKNPKYMMLQLQNPEAANAMREDAVDKELERSIGASTKSATIPTKPAASPAVVDFNSLKP